MYLVNLNIVWFLQVPRPGTSMKSTGPTTAASGGTSQAYRPTTQSGRPVSGVVRPGSQAGQGGMDTALRTPRTAKTARPVSAASGRHVRVGTGEFYPEFNSRALVMVHLQNEFLRV